MHPGGQSVGIVSARYTDISAARTVTAANTVSLFAQGAGMQLFAGQGKVDIQAQGDAVNIQALKDVTVTSNNGKVTVNASQDLTVVCGGAYIKISGGNIEMGCPGNIFIKLQMSKKWGRLTKICQLRKLLKDLKVDLKSPIWRRVK